MKKEDETFALSPWGCLYAVLKDYGVDISGITSQIGKHMVNDFMELMVKSGNIKIGNATRAEGAEE